VDDTEGAIMESWARHRTYSRHGSRETWSEALDVKILQIAVVMAEDIGGYGPTIIATMWAETGITLLFVALRLYTRYAKQDSRMG